MRDALARFLFIFGRGALIFNYGLHGRHRFCESHWLAHFLGHGGHLSNWYLTTRQHGNNLIFGCDRIG